MEKDDEFETILPAEVREIIQLQAKEAQKPKPSTPPSVLESALPHIIIDIEKIVESKPHVIIDIAERVKSENRTEPSVVNNGLFKRHSAMSSLSVENPVIPDSSISDDPCFDVMQCFSHCFAFFTQRAKKDKVLEENSENQVLIL